MCVFLCEFVYMYVYIHAFPPDSWKNQSEAEDNGSSSNYD